MANTDDLTLFLYILMRDHLPVGAVRTIMKQVTQCEGKERIYSIKLLAEYARELADELVKA